MNVINKIAQTIYGRESEDSGYLVHNSIQLLLLQGGSVIVTILVNYILIKVSGVADYGSYVYIFNSISLLFNFCLLGVDTLLVKNVSVYDATGNYGKLKGILFFSLSVLLLSSIIIAVASINAKYLFKGIEDVGTIVLFSMIFCSLLLLALSTLSQAFLQALKKISLSQLTDKIIKPLLFLIAVAILFYSGKIALINLVWSNILAIGLASIISLVLMFKQIRFSFSRVKPEYDTASWSRSAAAFFIIGILYILNSKVDIFFLGFLRGSPEVGVYNILLRISEIVSFSLVVVNFVLAPLIARLFACGDLLSLQKVVTRSSKIVLIFGLAMIVAIIIFRNHLLFFFGVNVLNASEALMILCFGQFMNIFCGSVGVLLLMSGNEKFSILGLAISMTFNIVFDVILIPVYGIVGAAIATSGSLIIWNILMYLFVRKKLHIRTTAIEIL